MASQAKSNPAATIAFAPSSHSFSKTDLPKAVPTEATDTTPRGRIINDSARGTTFWEVQSDDGVPTDTVETDQSDQDRRGDEEEGDEEQEKEMVQVDGMARDVADGERGDGGDEAQAVSAANESADNGRADDAEEPKAWGKPFQLEWLSTTRLLFYRTRGLRNPLNGNREVKIARDGTEVDPEVGKKLVNLFHQTAMGSPAVDSGLSGPGFDVAGHRGGASPTH